MIKTKHSRVGLRPLTFIAALLMIVSCHGHRDAIKAEGSQWLKWDANTRKVYVGAYVWGMQRGYSRGCEAAMSAARPPINGPERVETSDRCWKSYPISGRDSMEFIDSITEFYNENPKQRCLRISDILLRLHAGDKISQIHESLPQCNDEEAK